MKNLSVKARIIISVIAALSLAAAVTVTLVIRSTRAAEAAERSAIEARIAAVVKAAEDDAEFYKQNAIRVAEAAAEKVRSEAHAEFTAQRDAAQAALDATPHAAQEIRDALAGSIANLNSVLDSENYSAALLRKAGEPLPGAVQAVNESEAAWQAAEAARIEAERVAAEKAAAEQAARDQAARDKANAGSGKGGNSGGGNKGGSTGGGNTGGGKGGGNSGGGNAGGGNTGGGGSGGGNTGGGSSNNASKANYVGTSLLSCKETGPDSWDITYSINYNWGSVRQTSWATGIPEIQTIRLGDGSVVEVWGIDCW